MTNDINTFIIEVGNHKQRLENDNYYMDQIYKIKKESANKTLIVNSPETMAVLRRLVEKATGLFAYDTQIMAALHIYEGKVVEMKTGEGKTLAAAIAACMHLLNGRKVHIMTANDYLVKRDCAWASGIYESLGYHTMAMTSESTESERINSSNYGVVYTTNKEVALNYSSNRKANRSTGLIYNHFDVLIVDEADLLMIDESRTELSIGDERVPDVELFNSSQVFIKNINEKDYRMGKSDAEFCLTDEGIKKAKAFYGFDEYFSPQNLVIRNAIRLAFLANYFYKRDINYIIKDNCIVLVNSQTGRLMNAYKMLNGLQQAIECKEGLNLTPIKTNFTKIPYQHIFNQYKHKSGMTGTAITEAREFKEVYGLDVVVIPTNKPIARIDLVDRVYVNKQSRDVAVVQRVKEIHSKGQPVLVGTASIEHSESLADLLRAEGLSFSLLDAKHHENEAMIIQMAGWKNAITIATNMAGRGTDIKVPKEVLEIGGLYIIGAERYSSRRADNQLRGRTGRQGDVGYSQFFVSLEDDIMDNLNVGSVKGLMSLRKGVTDSDYIENQAILKLYNRAQIALEGKHYDERLRMLAKNKNISSYYQNFFNRKLHLLKNEFSKEQLLEMLMKSYQKDRSSYLRRFGQEFVNAIDISVAECKEQVDMEGFYELFNKGWAEFISGLETISINMFLNFSAKGDASLLMQKRISDNYTDMVLKLKVELIKYLQK